MVQVVFLTAQHVFPCEQTGLQVGNIFLQDRVLFGEVFSCGGESVLGMLQEHWNIKSY